MRTCRSDFQLCLQCVHRDIKLENLLLDSKDAVQVRGLTCNTLPPACQLLVQ